MSKLPAPNDDEPGHLNLNQFATIATAVVGGSSLSSLTANGLLESRDFSDHESDSGHSEGNNNTDLQRRQEHNVCERRRRNNIRHGFDCLQRSIPHAAGMKLSKMEILRTGIAHMKRLKLEISELEKELVYLRQMKETRMQA